MNQKRILFLGGAYAQIPIIKEAKVRGWYIITCDYLPDNPGHQLADEYHNVSTTDTEKILALAKKLKPDFVVAYASDPAAPVAAFVSEKLGLPGNSYESVKLLSEKDLFRDFLAKNGFNTPKIVSIADKNIDIEKIKQLQFPLIVKPTDSSGSKGVSKIEHIDKINEAVEYALSFSRNKRLIIEEYIEGKGSQLHGDGFVYNGDLIFSYIGDHHYNNQINPFVPYSTTWPSIKTAIEIKKVQDEISRAIKLTGYKNGAINIEARITENGNIYIMEIGPRSGGNFVPQVIEYATGFNMVKATLDCLCEKKVHVKTNYRKAAAYYVLHSDKEGILNSIEIDDKIKPFIKEFHQYIQPGNPVKSFQGANAAIGILLLAFSSESEMDYYISNMSKLVTVSLK
jgi:biotin carboxylase